MLKKDPIYDPPCRPVDYHGISKEAKKYANYAERLYGLMPGSSVANGRYMLGPLVEISNSSISTPASSSFMLTHKSSGMENPPDHTIPPTVITPAAKWDAHDLVKRNDVTIKVRDISSSLSRRAFLNEVATIRHLDDVWNQEERRQSSSASARQKFEIEIMEGLRKESASIVTNSDGNISAKKGENKKDKKDKSGKDTHPLSPYESALNDYMPYSSQIIRNEIMPMPYNARSSDVSSSNGAVAKKGLGFGPDLCTTSSESRNSPALRFPLRGYSKMLDVFGFFGQGVTGMEGEASGERGGGSSHFLGDGAMTCRNRELGSLKIANDARSSLDKGQDGSSKTGAGCKTANKKGDPSTPSSSSIAAPNTARTVAVMTVEIPVADVLPSSARDASSFHGLPTTVELRFTPQFAHRHPHLFHSSLSGINVSSSSSSSSSSSDSSSSSS
eukprot:CAMPEP_0175080628 /NCGR_PEP_ID=MMETSP0052_2-20121109/25624_1 /TAXON_ID=51329 ORGANISM="Polytomella parva, Strain SAG 63-3" /NCGR_SAMPLE_ID=MMETSP0052_2 /ASSEMBLY_ACC=CAM_ASM_000194 /LENGTH=443 /DNA_ID=CAMNT_0016351371 /DNA_START=116 /DNA_END=1447 /DNA_ORIENTATION=-